MTNLQARLVSALVLAAIVLLATISGGWLFAVMAAAVAVLIWGEWVDVACPLADDRVRLLGFGAIALVFLAALFLPNAALFWIAVIALAGFALVCWGIGEGPWPVYGLVYAGATFVAVIMLRSSSVGGSGLIAILFLYATVWATDIGAYFAGRRFGGPKVAVAISPNKTWSGAIGGAASAVVAGVLVFSAAGLEDTATAIGLALFLSVVAQAGDFFESWIKRRNGVKDTSQIMPGHGGMMDRTDGLIAAAIALWLLGLALAGPAESAAAFFV
ncbi:phosphatidate cytidylyltransferase [Oricola cellulosilytica]|uniref:Phosphatidate cytidylyltransferase n=1 Tax=Oricola cellulosilytica TaxID=1429082 RepID=A0A4R0P854_9HYPH|nr:phosphatidate cytidylyltransferase [Oricola cellulosilytica]TCD13211.1 phosphatidate cytidylyltransferase [Oricola cellulosilytica]